MYSVVQLRPANEHIWPGKVILDYIMTILG